MAIPTNIKTLLPSDVAEWAKIEFKETWGPAVSLKSVCAFAIILITGEAAICHRCGGEGWSLGVSTKGRAS